MTKIKITVNVMDNADRETQETYEIETNKDYDAFDIMSGIENEVSNQVYS